MKKFASLFAVMALATLATVQGVNAPGRLISARQPDGSYIDVVIVGNEFDHNVYSSDGQLLTTDENGFYVPATNGTAERRDSRVMRGPGLTTSYFPSIGHQRALVILVEFADREFSMENPKDFYFRMLNEEGYADDGATGSARDYFIANSNGQFIPEFDVYGPVKLEGTVADYGANDRWGNDAHPQEMAIQACEALDDVIDFSQYDRNSDGIIDNIFFYYAGYGEADGGGASTIWPHSTKLSLVYNRKFIYDGVEFDRYACSNELQSALRPGKPDGIGTFCHEFAHVLGLPDLYATTFINVETPGDWDLMDNGSYNNDGQTPPYLSSYERYALDWLTPVALTEGEHMLHPIHVSNTAFIYETGVSNEYFLFENRQQEGYDEYVKGHGMLVWLINYRKDAFESNSVNNFFWQQHVDLIEADGSGLGGSRAGDPFPGSGNVTSFTPFTRPAFKGWTAKEIPIGIGRIKETDGIISFEVAPSDSPIFDETDEEEDPGDNEDEGECSGVKKVEDALSFEISGKMVVNHEGVMDIYELSGRKAATLGAHSSIILTSGFYIARKDSRSTRILIP